MYLSQQNKMMMDVILVNVFTYQKNASYGNKNKSDDHSESRLQLKHQR